MGDNGSIDGLILVVLGGEVDLRSDQSSFGAVENGSSPSHVEVMTSFAEDHRRTDLANNANAAQAPATLSGPSSSKMSSAYAGSRSSRVEFARSCG